jgi:hypothetical protein
MQRKFGILSIITAIVVVSVVFLSMSIFSTSSKLFVDGYGEERVRNALDMFDDGERIVVINRCSSEDLNHLVDRVYDEPRLFWVDMKYNALSIGDVSVVALREKYDDIENKRVLIDDAASSVIDSVISSDMKEYDKVLAIHDWICENITYGAGKNDSDQDIYGALVLRRAMCAGYAEAFAYLLDKVGIESQVISGDSINKYGESVPHAWNIVYIDDEPYYFDVTWNDDDKSGETTYDWFGVTSEDFKKSHFPNVGYEWVKANATEACYYIRNGMYIKEYNAANIARQITKQGKTFYIKCANREVMNETIESFGKSEELQKIMKSTGISYINQIIYEENNASNCLKVIVQ